MDFFSQVIRNEKGAVCILRGITIVPNGAVVIYDRTESTLTFTQVAFVDHSGRIPTTITAGGRI